MTTNITSLIQMTGAQLWAEYKSAELKPIIENLDSRAPLWCTDASGTNAVVVTPDRGLNEYDDMIFLFVAANTNTGAMTLKIGALDALPLKMTDGALMPPGAIPAGHLCCVAHVRAAGGPGHFRLLNPALSRQAPTVRIYENDGTGGAIPDAAFTWTKPEGLSYVEVRVIGGGGGGAVSFTSYCRGGGAGGGAEALITDADLPATVAVTVGAGGRASDGRASQFGSLCIASGGRYDADPGKGVAGDILIEGGRIMRGTGSATTSSSGGSVYDQIGGSAPFYGGRKASRYRNTNTGDGNYGAGATSYVGSGSNNYDSEGNSGVVIVKEYF